MKIKKKSCCGSVDKEIGCSRRSLASDTATHTQTCGYRHLRRHCYLLHNERSSRATGTRVVPSTNYYYVIIRNEGRSEQKREGESEKKIEANTMPSMAYMRWLFWWKREHIGKQCQHATATTTPAHSMHKQKNKFFSHTCFAHFHMSSIISDIALISTHWNFTIREGSWKWSCRADVAVGSLVEGPCFSLRSRLDAMCNKVYVERVRTLHFMPPSPLRQIYLHCYLEKKARKNRAMYVVHVVHMHRYDTRLLFTV